MRTDVDYKKKKNTHQCRFSSADNAHIFSSCVASRSASRNTYNSKNAPLRHHNVPSYHLTLNGVILTQPRHQLFRCKTNGTNSIVRMFGYAFLLCCMGWCRTSADFPTQSSERASAPAWQKGRARHKDTV